MSRAKPLDVYPSTYYWAAVRRCLDADAPFLVPCTRQQAASLRGEIHGWRRACEQPANADQCAELGIKVGDMRKWFLRITDKGLEIAPVRLMVGIGLLEGALGGAPEPVVSEAEASLKEFLKSRET